MKHKASPLGLDEKEDDEDSLDELRIKILMYFLKIDENSILSFNSKKFSKSIPTLARELAIHIDRQEYNDDFNKEAIYKLSAKTKIIFDSNKDDDTIINVMTKAYGKSNLLFFHNFTTYWPRSKRNINSINSVFLKGKTEFDKNIFDFTNNDSIFYGNFEDDNFNYTSFQGLKTSIFVKNKKDSIYAAFYRNYTDEIQLRKVKLRIILFLTMKMVITFPYQNQTIY